MYGQSGKLCCLRQPPKNHAPPEWQHSIQAAAANDNVNITAFLLLHHA